MQKENVKTLSLFIVIITLIIIYVSGIYIFNEDDNYVYTSNNHMIDDSSLALMYETSEGSGEYQVSNDTNWPTDGYNFNATLSRCENGSTLSFDSATGKVLVEANVSDKCYIYFDVRPTPKLAEHIKSTYGTDSTLLLHNSSLTNGANDGSYRYSGASASVNNYVCFGSDAATCPTDNLYRIIGVFGDQVKLIKADYGTTTQLGTDGDYSQTYAQWGMDSTYKGTIDGNLIGVYYWNYKAGNSAVNNWTTSLLNKTNLNTNYINNIGSTWANKIATTTWKVGGNTWANMGSVVVKTSYTNEIVSPAQSTTYNAKIGLMYVSDYGYAASQASWATALNSYNSVTANNWMYMGLYEWTISRSSDYADFAFIVHNTGRVGGNIVNSDIAVRPSFYLTSSVKMISGSGSAADPYRIQ